MYPDKFDYYQADSVADAIELLEDHADAEVELLAGGHSLLPTMKTGLASPDVLIDIGNIDALDGIDDQGETTRIGANTNYATIAESDVVWANAPVVAEAAAAVGDIQVRNRGTIGGNIAHSDPAGDPPAAVLAADAVIHAQGPDGERAIDADDFFIAMYSTALEEDEIVTGVEIPNQGPRDTGAYVKKASPSSGYAMVGVAVSLETNGETVDTARVAANGALDHATRLEGVEDALAGASLGGELVDAAEHATEGIEEWEFMDDLQASADFRAQLLEVYTGRAIEAALDRVDAGAVAAD